MLPLLLIALVSSTSALATPGQAEVRAAPLAAPLARHGSYHSGYHGSSGLSSLGTSLLTTIITAFIAGLFGAAVSGLIGRSLPVEEREREEGQARVLAVLQDREMVARLARLGRKIF